MFIVEKARGEEGRDWKVTEVLGFRRGTLCLVKVRAACSGKDALRSEQRSGTSFEGCKQNNCIIYTPL